MDLGIAGKRAVITGGSGGLGFAVAMALAAEGVDLVLVARGGDALEGAREAVKAAASVKVDLVTADITRIDDVLAMSSAIADSGGLDILVLNTPRPPSPMRAFLDENDDDRWDAARRDQLDASVLILRHLAPLFVNSGKGWGRIIGITSASIKEPMPKHALSTIFRAGMQAALKHLSHELGPYGVTVNSVAPATVVTPTFSAFHNLDERVAGTALKRAGTAEELAATVAFLASQQAGFISGQVVHVDGGRGTSLH